MKKPSDEVFAVFTIAAVCLVLIFAISQSKPKEQEGTYYVVYEEENNKFRVISQLEAKPSEIDILVSKLIEQEKRLDRLADDSGALTILGESGMEFKFSVWKKVR